MCMHKDAYAISSQSKVSENRVPSFNVLQSSTPSVEQFDFSIFPILVLSSFFLLQVHLPFCTMDTRPPVVMGVSSFWSKSEGRVKGKEFFFFSSSFFFFLFLSFDWSKFSDETTYSSRSNLFLFYSFPRVTMQLRILCHGRWTRMDGWTVDGMRFLVTRFLFRFNWSIVPRWIQPGN